MIFRMYLVAFLLGVVVSDMKLSRKARSFEIGKIVIHNKSDVVIRVALEEKGLTETENNKKSMKSIILTLPYPFKV